MPPQIYGQPGEEPGDQHLNEALHYLPNECIVYAQPKLVYKSEVRYPDYVVVYHRWGVVVLEVKDWVEVANRDRTSAWVRRRNGQVGEEISPVEQARGAAHVLAGMLRQDEDLRDYAGRLDFSYAYAGVLPHLPMATVRWLEQAWGETYLLGSNDLRQDRFTEKIGRIRVPFRNVLSERQVRAICAVLDAQNKSIDRATGEFKGVYDRLQESIYKQPLAVPQKEAQPEGLAQSSFAPELMPSLESRAQHLESGMPEDVAALKSVQHVRLVRGFAGTGKTDILVLRAHYLHAQHPDLNILVTTFNDPVYQSRLRPELQDLAPQVDVIKFDTLCAGIFKKKHDGQWVSPQDTGGLVAKMAQDFPLIDELGQAFIADEFIWMKETGRTQRQRYMDDAREGRGGASGRTLGHKLKEQVFDLFEAYQDRLRDLPAHDWVDLHEKSWRYLQEGVRPEKQYDVILIDEAQHFAPIWMRIIQKFLKPGGTLFLCDDPSQSVYRYYSWRQKGVDVVGRTRWLRTPYRSTRQIFEAAYSLITDNPLAQRLLAEAGEGVQPDLDSTTMKEGPRPQVHFCASSEDEREFLLSQIETLINRKGVLPREIGILHEQKFVLDRYRRCVPAGVQLYEVKRQTGLEYKAVFIPHVQDMLDRKVGVSWEEDQVRQRLKFYMTMTRARSWLYMMSKQQWPTVLEPVRPYVDWIESSATDYVAVSQ